MIENPDPKQSWHFMQDHSQAIMIDVRTETEFSFVGHPLKAIHIAWKELPSMQNTPVYLDQIKKIAPDLTRPVLLLWRSGQRLFTAAEELQSEGYQYLINIAEGFEGPLDENKRRGNLVSWRFHGLPWQQS